jgi:hypothetical protein
MSKRLSVVTFQTGTVVDALKSDAALTRVAAFVEDEWKDAYDWMHTQLLARCGPPPTQNGLVFWGWPLGGEPADKDVLGSDDEPLYRIDLTLAEADVLASDFQAWHLVLSGSYLGASTADADRFDAQPGQETPAMVRERLASWERVFDPSSLDPDCWGKPEERIYQLCFWQPEPRAVVSVSTVSP